MPTPSIMPSPRMRFVDNVGLPLANGMVFTFAAGTSDMLAAFQDPDGLIPHANPIRLDIRGEALIYWLGNYKVDIRNSLGIQLAGYPVDNYNAVDPTVAANAGIAAVVASYASSIGSSLLGFLQAGVGAIKRTMQDKAREWKTPEDFGAKGNDPSFDDTPALTALFESAAANGHSVMLPRKTYYVTSVTILNCNETTVISQGAKFRGKYTGSYPHILRIDQTSITMNIDGTLIIDGACNVGYGCGVFVGSGYNMISGISFVRTALCWKIDRDFLTDGNRGVSEIQISRGYSYACLRVVEAIGFNTVVNFNGFMASTGLLTDADTSDLPGGVRPAAWDIADSTTVRAIGATLIFTGHHATNVRGTDLIDIQPIISPDAPTVAIDWGSVTMVGANVEAIQLGGASNPNNYPTPTDANLHISLLECKGFIGGNKKWIKLHGTFNGMVRIKGGCFYTNNPRTEYLGESISGYAHWDVDPQSFGKNIRTSGLTSGLDGFTGGIAHFKSLQILRLNNCATATASDGSVVPRCTNAVNVGNSSRYIAAYGLDGVFTVPAGGLQDVIFDASFVLAIAAAGADIGVKLNGVIYKYGSTSASSAKNVTAYFPRLEEGDKIAPFLANNTGAPVACDGSALNQIIITASNP